MEIVDIINYLWLLYKRDFHDKIFICNFYVNLSVVMAKKIDSEIRRDFVYKHYKAAFTRLFVLFSIFLSTW